MPTPAEQRAPSSRHWHTDDLAERYAFRLFPDGTGEGPGPDGATHTRFRAWKEALRDA